MNYKKFITGILKKAEKVAIDGYGKVEAIIKDKDPNQILTATDIEVGKVLVGEIQKFYPKHNVIDEEAGVIDNKSDFTWVVDPIDGTSNFVQGNPAFGIMVGLLEKECPLAGGLLLPGFSEIYYGEKEKGAFVNGKRIKVTNEKRLINALVAYGIDGYQEKPDLTKKECQLLEKIILKIRNLRASNSAYDFAMVAKGVYGAYLNQTSKIWDNVAPQVIIEEAGGIYTDFYGNPIDYSQPLKRVKDNFDYCTASPKLHAQLLKIIKKV